MFDEDLLRYIYHCLFTQLSLLIVFGYTKLYFLFSGEIKGKTRYGALNTYHVSC